MILRQLCKEQRGDTESERDRTNSTLGLPFGSFWRL
jgi:hypothetical protein